MTRNPKLGAMRLVRSVAILIVAGILLWFTLAVTDALVARGDPGRGLGWWSSAARHARAATVVVLDPSRRDQLPQARIWAQAALNREPVNVMAVRTLAIIEAQESDYARAAQLFRYAEALSRRDVPTQLWLIEEKVQRNDIEGALRHYDRLLRVSPPLEAQLVPILINAAATPAIRGRLAAMIASRPPWWTSFAHRLVAESRSPAAIFELIARLRLDPAKEPEREVLIAAMSKLASLSAYDSAYALYARSGQSRPGEALLRDGGFESDNLLPPFDWRLADEADLAATRQPRRGGAGRHALFFFSDQGRTGAVAQQLLILEPRRYRLAALLGNVSAAAPELPTLVLACVGSPERELTELEFPPSTSTAAAVRADFSVPSDCPAQIIRVIARSSLDQRSEAWIDSIELHRL